MDVGRVLTYVAGEGTEMSWWTLGGFRVWVGQGGCMFRSG